MTEVGSKLMFYCVKGRHKQSGIVIKVVTKKGRRFAVSKCVKHGIPMWRILGKA